MTTNIVSKREAAKKLGKTEAHIDAMISRGELRDANFEGQAGIWSFDLLAAMRKQRAESKQWGDN